MKRYRDSQDNDHSKARCRSQDRRDNNRSHGNWNQRDDRDRSSGAGTDRLRDRDRDRDKDRERDRDRDRDRYKERDYDQGKDRERSRDGDRNRGAGTSGEKDGRWSNDRDQSRSRSTGHNDQRNPVQPIHYGSQQQGGQRSPGGSVTSNGTRSVNSDQPANHQNENGTLKGAPANLTDPKDSASQASWRPSPTTPDTSTKWAATGGKGGKGASPTSPTTPEPSAMEAYLLEDHVNYDQSSEGPRISGPPILYSIYRARVLMPSLVELEALQPFGVDLETPALAQLVDPGAPKTVGLEIFCKVVAINDGVFQVSMRECDQSTGKDLNPCPSFAKCTADEPRNQPLQIHQSETSKQVSDSINPLAMWATSQLKSSAPEESSGVSFGFSFAQEAPTEVKDESDEDLPVTLMEYRTPKFLEGEAWKDESEVNVVMEYRTPPFLRGVVRQTDDFPLIKVASAPEGSLKRAALQQVQCLRERRLQERFSISDKHPDMDLGNSAGGSSRTQANSNTNWHGLQAERMALPIYQLRGELMKAVASNQVLVVIGQTGSGKTTQLTQYLVEEGFAPFALRIGCTQPRRIAAVTVARRVAQEVGCMLGTLVGYAVRFEDCTSQMTKIKYMTDGLLLREALADRTLSTYSALIIDEAHERALCTDVLFGLLKGVLARRTDLKLIVTSATLDAAKFSAYFGNCPILTIPGTIHPVDIIYAAQPEMDYVDAAVQTTLKVHTTEPAPGDILLFLTGQEEIEVACQCLQTQWREFQKQGKAGIPELIVLPIYAAMPPELQGRIFDPAPPNSRKVVVATNIAETSLTIDGIMYVIDCGFMKQKIYDSKTGVESLTVVPISQMGAKQRAGRAGRTGPGKCYRLYTEAAFTSEMLPDTVPEICRAKLNNVVLTLKAMGITDLLQFDFLDSPDPQGFFEAMASLHGLGALDDHGNLTPIGRRMADFPLEPMLSRMLLAGCDLGCAAEVLIIAAMLSAGNIFFRPKGRQLDADACKAQFIHTGGDHLTYLNIFRRWERAKFDPQWCFANYLNVRVMKQAYEVREQLADLLSRRCNLGVESTGGHPGMVQKAVCTGYFLHVAKRTKDGYVTLSQNSSTVFIHPSSVMFTTNESPPWLIYHELLQTSRGFMRDVVAINPRWLPEIAPAYFDIRPNISVKRIIRQPRNWEPTS